MALKEHSNMDGIEDVNDTNDKIGMTNASNNDNQSIAVRRTRRTLVC
jgi:hypothetical protein